MLFDGRVSILLLSGVFLSFQKLLIILYLFLSFLTDSFPTFTSSKDCFFVAVSLEETWSNSPSCWPSPLSQFKGIPLLLPFQIQIKDGCQVAISPLFDRRMEQSNIDRFISFHVRFRGRRLFAMNFFSKKHFFDVSAHPR